MQLLLFFSTFCLELLYSWALNKKVKIIIIFQVMTETNTLINWPARLKIGARSKKGTYNTSNS